MLPCGVRERTSTRACAKLRRLCLMRGSGDNNKKGDRRTRAHTHTHTEEREDVDIYREVCVCVYIYMHMHVCMHVRVYVLRSYEVICTACMR